MRARLYLLLFLVLPAFSWSASAELDLPYSSYDIVQNPVNGDVNLVLRGSVADFTDTVFACQVGTGSDQITLRARTSALNLDQRLAMVLTAVATKSAVRAIIRDDASAVPEDSPYCAIVNLTLVPRPE